MGPEASNKFFFAGVPCSDPIRVAEIFKKLSKITRHLYNLDLHAPMVLDLELNRK